MGAIERECCFGLRMARHGDFVQLDEVWDIVNFHVIKGHVFGSAIVLEDEVARFAGEAVWRCET